MITGNCNCNTVRFEITGPLALGSICHCGQCRRQAGHAWASSQIDDAHLNFVSDATLKWYRSSTDARRGFCGECGSFLFWKNENEDKISVSAGVLNEPTGLRLNEHIFAADKGDYYDLNDSLPVRKA